MKRKTLKKEENRDIDLEKVMPKDREREREMEINMREKAVLR